MYQVAVLPPVEALGTIEQFRRLHDPAFHRMPANVPLLPPFEPVRQDVLARFDDLRCAPFDARLGAPEAHGTSLILTMIEGAAEITALQSALHVALLDPAAPPAEAPPSLRIGHFSSLPALELARRGLGTTEALPTFRVTQVSLLLEDVRGIWHPVRERVLRGAPR